MDRRKLLSLFGLAGLAIAAPPKLARAIADRSSGPAVAAAPEIGHRFTFRTSLPAQAWRSMECGDAVWGGKNQIVISLENRHLVPENELMPCTDEDRDYDA